MVEAKFNKYFNVFITAGMAVCVVLSCLGKMQSPDARKVLLIVSAIGALMGVVSTVLSANGSIWTFVFGLIDVSIYSYILFDSHMPSQFLLHVLYFIPMEFVGFYQWKKRGADGKKKVKARRLDAKGWLKYSGLFVAVLAVSFGVSYLITAKASGGFGADALMADALDYPKMLLDATITTANIVALVLMALAYMEQWYLWTLVNISSIIIWTLTLVHDPGADYAIIPLVKYSFYLINGINGIRIWYNLSRADMPSASEA